MVNLCAYTVDSSPLAFLDLLCYMSAIFYVPPRNFVPMIYFPLIYVKVEFNTMFQEYECL